MKSLVAATFGSLFLFAIPSGAQEMEIEVETIETQDRTPEKIVLVPEEPGTRAFFEDVGLVEAVVVGDMAWLSGVVAGEQDGIPTEESIDATFAYAGTILERAGFGWQDVVDITTYHVDLPATIDALATVKKRYIPDGAHAWTAIDIDRLYTDEGMIEIKITARRAASD